MKRFRSTTVSAIALIAATGLAVFLGSPGRALAEEKINAAVVAGFIQTFQGLSSAFEAQTGIKVDVSFSSAGGPHGPTAQGGPCDNFLFAGTPRAATPFREKHPEKTSGDGRGAAVSAGRQRGV